MQLFKKIISILMFTTFISSIALGSLIYADSNTNLVQDAKVGWLGMSVGYIHSLAVKKDGTVWYWGQDIKEPTQVEGLNDVISIAAGEHHSLALKKDGTVWSWGNNNYGQLGDGTFNLKKLFDSSHYLTIHDRHMPAQVNNLTHVIAISAEKNTNFAIKDDGTVWAWGDFALIKGQINYKFMENPNPVQLKYLTDVTSILITDDGYWALKKDGTLWTSNSFENEPMQETHISNIKQFAVSNYSMYFLKFDGTIMAWGATSIGEFWDGINPVREDVVLVKGINDVESLASGTEGPIYLKKDGTLWTSDDNSGGVYGVNSYVEKNIPIQIKGMSKVKLIAATTKGFRFMVLREDNTLWSWGNGFVGDGTEWWRTVPVMIKSYDSQVLQDVNTIRVDLNGKELEFDQLPVLIENRTMVPLRGIFEELGAKIQWDQNTDTVTAIKGQIIIKLTVGSDVAYINDNPIKLDAAPVSIHGRTLVPTRFIGEALGANVNWDGATNTVEIKTE